MQIIFFHGPDGSGKTTIITRLAAILISQKIDFKIAHLSPASPVNLDILSNSDRAEIPSMTASRGRLFMYGKLFYFAFRYWADLIKSRYFMKYKYVIYDRSYYEFILDPLRMGGGKIPAIKFLLPLIFPRPDFVVTLIGPPLDLANRKNEISVERIANYINASLDIKFKKVIVVDTFNTPINKSIDILCRFIGI